MNLHFRIFDAYCISACGPRASAAVVCFVTTLLLTEAVHRIRNLFSRRCSVQIANSYRPTQSSPPAH